MIYISVVALVAVCGIIMVWPMFFTSKSIRNYKGVSQSVFTEQLAVEGVPEHISAAVFNYYKEKARYKPFSPSPDMNIVGVFGELPEDVDEAAIDLLKQLHLEVPSEAERMAWPGDDIRTAGDMARWLQWASEHQPT